MITAKKSKYLTKSIKFGSQLVTLYSLDGLTWSTRRSELQTIKERIESQRITLGASKDEEGAPAAAASSRKNSDSEDKDIEDADIDDLGPDDEMEAAEIDPIEENKPAPRQRPVLRAVPSKRAVAAPAANEKHKSAPKAVKKRATVSLRRAEPKKRPAKKIASKPASAKGKSQASGKSKARKRAA